MVRLRRHHVIRWRWNPFMWIIRTVTSAMITNMTASCVIPHVWCDFTDMFYRPLATWVNKPFKQRVPLSWQGDRWWRVCLMGDCILRIVSWNHMVRSAFASIVFTPVSEVCAPRPIVLWSGPLSIPRVGTNTSLASVVLLPDIYTTIPVFT